VKNAHFFLVAIWGLVTLGLLTSCTPPAPALGVSPNGAVLTLSEPITLTATLFNTSLQSEIAWTSTGGVLSTVSGPTVSFRADQEGVYKVTATAASDPSLTRTVTLTVGQEVRAGTSDAPVLAATLASGAVQTFVLKPTDFSKSALYTELISQGTLTLSLYNQNGRHIASSNTAAYFSEDGNNLLRDNTLTAQAISEAKVCRGPCVITPARNQGYIIKLENKSAAAVSYQLFVYSERFRDGPESSENCDPTFNSFYSTFLTPNIEVIPPEPIVRAIETVNDEDCFFSEAKAGEVVLETFGDTVLEVELDVYQIRSNVDSRFVGSLSAGPGRDKDVLTFDPSYPVLIVAKSGDGRAAPSEGSRYAVNYY
jgi:hypothetical protein